MSAEKIVCCTSQFRKDSLGNVDRAMLRDVTKRLMTSVTSTGGVCLIRITIGIYDDCG